MRKKYAGGRSTYTLVGLNGLFVGAGVEKREDRVAV